MNGAFGALKKIAFTLLVVGILGGVFWYWRGKQVKSTKDVYIPTSEDAKATLLQKSSFELPQEASLKEVSQSSLPSDLSPLIKDASEGSVKIESALTAGGKATYKVTLSESVSLAVAYNGFFGKLKQQNGWTITSASRANAFAFIEARSNAHSIRVSLTPKETNKIEVLIEALAH